MKNIDRYEITNVGHAAPPKWLPTQVSAELNIDIANNLILLIQNEIAKELEKRNG